MNVQIFNRIAALAIFLPATHSVYAQKGSVNGIVTDATTKETIIGGKISLQGTLSRAATELNGNCRLAEGTPGPYSLLVTDIGYQPETLPLVIEDGETLAVAVALRSESTQMESVTIAARANMQNARALIAGRKDSATGG